jgi:putative ABC transport system permease protein
MRVLIAGLIGVLALIGLTNLATASAVGLRDHLRDVRVLEALGLTPLQVRMSLVTRTCVLALVAVGFGALLGLAACRGLINLASQIYGIGSGLGQLPSVTAIAIAVTAAVVASGLTAAIPARLTARLPAAEFLRA